VTIRWILGTARRRLLRLLEPDSLAQNFGHLRGIPPERIGYGQGRLTRQRQERHRTLRRPIHITLLEFAAGPSLFGDLHAFWINERSRLCSASRNTRVEEADILWVFSQDPLTPEARTRIDDAIRRAKPGARVLNHPDRYDAYHADDCFPRLAAAGVSVPRCDIGPEDVGQTSVVYKKANLQMAPKTYEVYQGPRPDYRAFEFIDSRRPSENLYRRGRAYYLAGIVRPSKLIYSEQWEVKDGSRVLERDEITFPMTPDEIRQVRLLAKTLRLDYFAVDFVRRGQDDRPFFTDINVYPDIYGPGSALRARGYFGAWHNFDGLAYLGIPDPLGRPLVEAFDEAMRLFVAGEPYPVADDRLG